MKDLDIKIEETTTTPWEVWYELLVAYKAEHGNCLVPYFYVTKNGYALWYWVLGLRSDKAQGRLTKDQIKRLEELNFVWVLQDHTWENGFAALQAYKEEFGDCLVPLGYVAKNQHPLGNWVIQQRSFDGNFPREKYHRLIDLGFVWNLRTNNWARAYAALEDYKEEHGDCFVPKDYMTEDGLELGAWAVEQRTNLHYGYLSQERMLKLEELGFAWATWDDSSPVVFISRKGKSQGS